jgi:glycerol-3-phosphate cytidylyltransferase-like family protein
MKTNQLKYSCAITYGRFCVGHFGHVELIQQMLNHGEYADVHLSGHEKNNDWDLRVLLLKYLCRLKGVDLSRVKFYNSPTVTEAMTFSVDIAPYNECVLVLGSDQIAMGTKIAEAFDTAFVINRRSTSSTEIRYFLDASEFLEDLCGLYDGDEFAITLAKILRQEELRRERSAKVTGEVGVPA